MNIEQRRNNMTGEEIKEKIFFNNQKIESLLDPSTFVLRPEVNRLIQENKDLRRICKHNFKNGVCVYCGTKK